MKEIINHNGSPEIYRFSSRFATVGCQLSLVEDHALAWPTSQRSEWMLSVEGSEDITQIEEATDSLVANDNMISYYYRFSYYFLT
jgi:hypothetical protein